MPPLPDPSRAVVAVMPRCDGPGCWVGAPSAVVVRGVTWLAYREREQQRRGGRLVIARPADGATFTPVVVLDKDRFGAESLERPALVITSGGRWRLYVCCATPHSKHWWIDLLDAPAPERLGDADAQTVFPGDEQTGVKDPVIRFADG